MLLNLLYIAPVFCNDDVLLDMTANGPYQCLNGLCKHEKCKHEKCIMLDSCSECDEDELEVRKLKDSEDTQAQLMGQHAKVR